MVYVRIFFQGLIFGFFVGFFGLLADWPLRDRLAGGFAAGCVGYLAVELIKTVQHQWLGK